LALLAISIVPAFFALKSDFNLAMSQGYFALYQRQFATGAAAGPQVLAAMLPTALVFLLAGAKPTRLSQYAPLCLLGLYAGIYMLMGFRGTAIATAASSAWLFDTTVKRIPRVLIAGAVVVAVLAVPVVRQLRHLDGWQQLDASTIKQVWSSIDDPVASTLSEMGGSLAALVYTIQLVPDPWPHEYGTTYFYALSTVFPNVFWTVHPSIAHSPSARLVQEVDPGTARAGGGLGYSCIAEAFLNFGWLGAPLALGLIGFGMGRLTHWLDTSGNPARVAAAAAALTSMIIFARGESAGVVRSVIWYSIVPYCLVVARRDRKFALRGNPGWLSAILVNKGRTFKHAPQLRRVANGHVK
jgi:oligosaccharide repeat unit polymerase